MKIYVEVYNRRTNYLKELLKKDYIVVTHPNKCDLKITRYKEDNSYSFQDMLEDDSFRHLNNTLTAVTLKRMLPEMKNALILGYGDLARQIASLLTCPTTIANRNNKHHDEIIQYYNHIDLNHIDEHYDIIINTIPHYIPKQKLQYNKYYDLAGSIQLDNYESLRSLPDVYFYKEGAHLMKMMIDRQAGK